MQTADGILKELDSIEERICGMILGQAAVVRLKTKLSELLSHVTVHNALTKTVQQIQESNDSKLRQSRIEKFLRVVYGGVKCKSCRDDSQWLRLRALDYDTFLLIAASYTPVDVAKLGQVEYEYLIKVAPEYLDQLSPEWMFRKEVQLAVATHAELGGMPQFKRKYHELEYSTPELQSSRKRLRMVGKNNDDKCLSPGLTQGALQEDAMSAAETSTGLGIETAFDLTPEVFEEIWKKLSNERVAGEPQSIILTIPAEDRVGSIVYSIPRRKAIMCGKEYNLPKLPLPTSA